MAMATTDAYAAAHRTLGLPELLALILGLQTEASSLASCMRVNSLWAQEAAKILWQKCGYQMQAIGDVRAPKIRDLAALSRWPDRLQWYANCIGSLDFFIEDFYRDDVYPEDYRLRDESRYHSAFTDITFPHLENILFSSSDRCYIYNKTSLLSQYLQSSLKSFCGFGYTCKGGAVLTDQFFSLMKDRCQSLQILELMLDTEHFSESKPVSKEGFAQFLDGMRQLRTLSIRQGFDDVMTSEAFGYLVQYQYLIHLDLPHIPEQWIRDLDPSVFPRGGLLPKINSFRAGLSDKGLNLLLPYLKNVTSIHIRPYGLFINAFSIIASAQLTALEHLSLDVSPDTIVRGADLIMLAATAERLEYLDIPGDLDKNDRLPSAISVTDAVMDELASHLPNLKVLSLKMDGALLTEASLISLGEYCKHLESCSISADVFFEALVRKGCPNMFPVLEELCIIQPVSDRREYKDVSQTTKLLLLAFPKLEYLDQGPGELSELDLNFTSAAQDAIFARNRCSRGLEDLPESGSTGPVLELL
ncbi:hypothetical protein MMC17_006301 [Xylographa soralifera]|nr:hypothetical protein [Xylographa soralifera]